MIIQLSIFGSSLYPLTFKRVRGFFNTICIFPSSSSISILECLLSFITVCAIPPSIEEAK